MAINVNNNLPSFSEMYNAYKNRGSLGEGISAGVNGYEEQRALNTKMDKERAEALEARAHADYYKTGKTQSVLLSSLTPEEQKQFAPEAAPNEQGQLVVPWQSVVSKRGGDKAGLDKQIADMKQANEAEKLKLMTENGARLSERDQTIADLQRQLLGQNKKKQAADADRSVLGATEDAKPDWIDKSMGAVAKGVGKIAGKVTKSTTTAANITNALTPQVLEDARMRQGALNRQELRGGMAQPAVSPSTEELMGAAHSPAPTQPMPKSVKRPGVPKPVYTQEDIAKLQEGEHFIDESGKVKEKVTINGVVYGRPVNQQR